MDIQAEMSVEVKSVTVKKVDISRSQVCDGKEGWYQQWTTNTVW